MQIELDQDIRPRQQTGKGSETAVRLNITDKPVLRC